MKTWLQEALCAQFELIHANIWFPDPDEDDVDDIEWKTDFAKTVCMDCPVQDQCLELGMRPDNIRWGIFGGLTSDERRKRAQQT